MQSLVDHQRWLARLILEPERIASDAAAAVRPVALDDVDAARVRLGAYVGGYPARLVEALEEAFPAIRTILGGDTFRELTGRYRVAVPAGVYSLSDVGVNLPSFLGNDALAARLPFLRDLATLEWAVLRAFHSFERERFDAAAVAGWGLEEWERARLTFQPAVAVVSSRWPILDLWQIRDTPREQRCEIDVVLEGRPQSVLVRREELSVACDIVSPAKAGLLVGLLGGATLGEALESLAEASEAPLDVAAWFAEWTTRGLVVDCRTA